MESPREPEQMAFLKMLLEDLYLFVFSKHTFQNSSPSSPEQDCNIWYSLKPGNSCFGFYETIES